VYLGPRLPFVDFPAQLWDYLEIPETNAADCRLILDSLATENADYNVDTHGTEIPVLRRLVALADQRGIKRALDGIPIRAYQGWTHGTTTVFAVRNKSVASEVGRHWPVWQLPISLTEVLPLVDLFGVTLLTDSDIQPDVPSQAIVTTDLQADFPTIVNHLRNFLVRNHDPLQKRITAERWHTLGVANVALGSG